ncbi:hypothetical protein K432DRAFT_293980 [Lepidopterella palustris CBS 459.81]|uniref:Uncharacterized protein n=1 Tax=Lepidopterella palustris CBS 459.81 TaxID=1314670 RepID=A0A8E2JGV3_9PEZI|nr:hypothetical protein K432DRAFT_293980 [Lepidopterella palustris CBS 459.81]
MSQTQAVYVHGDFSEPLSAQHNFANQFDLEHPHHAMSVYARIMHEHTRQQLNMATRSARRRSQGVTSAISSESSAGTINSTGS